MTSYETVIGLEIHVKLNTHSKMFCSCDNQRFGTLANTSVCEVCMGFPGMLPVTNEQAVYLGTKLSLAIGTEINTYNKFDRKSYFYPDLPKGYQISQFDQPLAERGRVEFIVGGEKRSVRITRLHLEEDAGKLMHEGETSLVDLNRAGAPLAEIVTEPDFRSADEVSSFLKELQAIARTVEAGQANMEKGEMRCDVNISIRPVGQEKLGTKVELKNMNSFSAVERAIAHEVERQRAMIEAGETILQQTRGWDDAKGITEAQRSKEDANDYRYFPEPDLQPLRLSEEYIASIRAQLPELPATKRLRYMTEWNIKEDEARLLSLDPDLSRYFEEVVKITNDPLKSCNILTSVLVAHLKNDKKEITESPISTDQLAELITLLNKHEISISALKTVLEQLYENGGSVSEIIESKGLKQVSDTGAIKVVVEKVLSQNIQMAEQYKSGTTKVLGALVGLVMKESGGKANPGVVNTILVELLSE